VTKNRATTNHVPGDEPEFYYDVRTGEVLEGKTIGWENRMGPYATRDAAAHALERARARTRAWDKEDAED
jgi:hypothetical protein